MSNNDFFVDESGQIHRRNPSQGDGQIQTHAREHIVQYGNEDKNRFFTTILILSPIIYAPVGALLNSAMNWGVDPGLAILIGAIAGFAISGLYGAIKARTYKGSDYAAALAAPAAVAILVAGFVIVVIVLIVLAVLAGMASGG